MTEAQPEKPLASPEDHLPTTRLPSLAQLGSTTPQVAPHAGDRGPRLTQAMAATYAVNAPRIAPARVAPIDELRRERGVRRRVALASASLGVSLVLGGAVAGMCSSLVPHAAIALALIAVGYSTIRLAERMFLGSAPPANDPATTAPLDPARSSTVVVS